MYTRKKQGISIRAGYRWNRNRNLNIKEIQVNALLVDVPLRFAGFCRPKGHQMDISIISSNIPSPEKCMISDQGMGMLLEIILIHDGQLQDAVIVLNIYHIYEYLI